MIATLMIGMLFGAALGQRFNVMVLVPAMAVVLLLSIGAGVAHPQAAWEILKMAASAAMGLQCGYFFGILIRHFLVAAPSQRTSSIATAKTSTHHAAR
jgi:hypothetical protein